MRTLLTAITLLLSVEGARATKFVCQQEDANLCLGISPDNDRPPTKPYPVQVKVRANQDAKNISHFKTRFLQVQSEEGLSAFALSGSPDYLIARPDPSDGQLWLTNELTLNDSRVWWGPDMSQGEVCATPMQCKDKPPAKPWCNPVANDPTRSTNRVKPGSYVKVRECSLDYETQQWKVQADCAPGCTMDLFLGPGCSPLCNTTSCLGGACGITLSPTSAPTNHSSGGEYEYSGNATPAPTTEEYEYYAGEYEYAAAPSVPPFSPPSSSSPSPSSSPTSSP